MKFEEVLIKSVRTNDDIDRNSQVLLFKKRNNVSRNFAKSGDQCVVEALIRKRVSDFSLEHYGISTCEFAEVP